MRIPVRRQSALRTPLNTVFGTEGGVRVLRALTSASSPMTVGALAERARLDRVATRRTLHTLVDNGIVELRGEGRVPQYVLRATHPLLPAISALFDAERRRADELLEGIRAVVGGLAVPPVAIWIEGPVAAETDKPGDPVVVRVVDSARTLSDAVDYFRRALRPLEEKLDVTIEVTGATPADLTSRRAADSEWEERLRTARSVAGLPPASFLRQPSTKSRPDVRKHADLDARGLAIAGAIAQRIKRDPKLIPRARAYVAKRMSEASPQERHDLEEWEQILRTTSPARLRRLLVDPGERATRLRQTLPFLGVLTPVEREAIVADATADAGVGP